MKKKSVLIIEDDCVFARSLFLHLQKEGYTCSFENNLDAALERIEKGAPPDLFILDYELGDRLNGLDLCRFIKARLQRPVLMLTGDDSEATAVRCLDAGADQYLVKPYKKDELLARMRSALRSYSRIEPAAEDSADAEEPPPMDMQRRVLGAGDKLVSLTEKETMLLDFFISNLGIEVSRDTVHFALYGAKPGYFSRNIDVLVGRVRKKLNSVDAPYSIKNVRSFGYIMYKPSAIYVQEIHEQRIPSDI